MIGKVEQLRVMVFVRQTPRKSLKTGAVTDQDKEAESEKPEAEDLRDAISCHDRR